MPSITLQAPVADTEILAGLHATNYAALQALLNGGLDNANLSASAAIAVSKIAPGLAGQFLGGTSPGYAYPPGHEHSGSYVEVTADVAIAGTTAAAATNVITSGSVTYDGTAIWVEAWIPRAHRGTTWIKFVLYDGATQLGELGGTEVSAAGGIGVGPFHFKRRLTPSAGAHTYSLKAFVDAGSGTVKAGTGASGALMPAWIRTTKV